MTHIMDVGCWEGSTIPHFTLVLARMAHQTGRATGVTAIPHGAPQSDGA